MKLRTALITYLSIVGILAYGNLKAYDGSFERGYEEGYRTIQGDIAIMPVTPIEPVTPIDSTPFREGIRQGIIDGRKEDYDKQEWR